MNLLEDVRFGFRTLISNPGFTIVAIVALALGIGVNGTVFTITNAVFFKSLQVQDSGRVLYMLTKNTLKNNQRDTVSFPDFRDWRAQAKSFASMGAIAPARVNVTDSTNPPEPYVGSRATANTLRVLGIKPVLGRDFAPEDEAPGATPVAILSYGLWESRYGRNTALIGQTIHVDGVVTNVIGVMPQGFAFFNEDLWMPARPIPEMEKREMRSWIVFGRLKDDATPKSAAAEMETISRNLAAAYPLTNQGLVTDIQTFTEVFMGPGFENLFIAMMGAVSFVLLIACANVANMLLARAVGRSREISIRVALGARRWRIIRQLLIESIMLSSVAGVLGWGIGYWGARAFDMATIPFGKPKWIDMSMDYRVFIYLAFISIMTGVLFGLAPALRLSRLDVNSTIKDGTRGSTVGRRGKYLSSVLVVAEMALAVILLAGAGLFIRSFLNVYRASLGVNTSNVMTFRLTLPDAKYPHPQDMIAFHDRLKSRLESLPGVDSVSIATTMPTGGSMDFPFELEGAVPDPNRRPSLQAVVISPDFFRVWQVPGIEGRLLAETDNAAAPPVAVVNQYFANKFWPAQSAVGKRLRLFNGKDAEPWLQVVGVIPNIVQNDVTPNKVDPVIYLPFRQKPMAGVAVMARTKVAPGTLAMPFRKEVQAIDSNMPVFNLWTMEERLERNYWFYRIMSALFGIFAAIALLLAAVGLYAVIAHSVSQRTQELGVRLAIGASASDILRLIFLQGMRQLLIGLSIGLAGSFIVTRLLRTILVQVSPTDPTTLAFACATLALAAVLGCWLPARRAMRVDPIVALHYE
jgi:putative ABC transport system permease protein